MLSSSLKMLQRLLQWCVPSHFSPCSQLCSSMDLSLPGCSVTNNDSPRQEYGVGSFALHQADLPHPGMELSHTLYWQVGSYH